MNVTAVTISREPAPRELPGLEHLNHAGQVINTAADACDAWFSSIAKVRTPWFFWLDSDDALPSDHLSVIEECQQAAADLDIAYTDELVIGPAESKVRQGKPYDRALHFSAPLLLHHMVLVRTDAARAALAGLPHGHYWPEMLLFWALGRRGAAYVPRVGYHWHQSASGLSKQWFTSVGMVQSQLWAKANP